MFADTVRPQLAQIVGRVFLGVNGPLAGEAKADADQLLGRTMKLIAIGPQDACYAQRSKYQGHAGTVIEAEQWDGWLRGTFCFDKPLFEGDNRVYSFLQFQVEPLQNAV
jgi:hypothetical protein